MSDRESYAHVDSPAQGRPLYEAICKDHDVLRDYYQQYKKASNDEDRQKWANVYLMHNAVHAMAEELVIYPVMDKVGLKHLADEDRAAHQKVKESIYKMQSMKASDADFGQTFDTAFKNLWEHVVPEERDDLPQLEEKLSMEESVKLAKQFRKTKQWAPTRSHPSAPAHTPFETAAALLAAPLDRLSDMLRSYPDEEDVDKAHTMQREYMKDSKL